MWFRWIRSCRRKLANYAISLKLHRTEMEVIKTCAKVVQRIFLANVIILRESAGFVAKRVGDMYRAGYFNIYQDRGQKILIGACLISFAQDSISEDEMLSTVETFDVDKYNEFLAFCPSKVASKEEGIPSPNLDTHRKQSYSSLESPLTFYVRDLRRSLNERRQEFMKKVLILEEKDITAPPPKTEASITPLSSPRGQIITNISSRLSTDGTGFVDSSWELVFNRPDLRMWRRLSSKGRASDDKNTAGLYEYRVCGSFTDISARCFLEVQLNLAYRRHWDKSVVLLESTRSGGSEGASESEVIRWVTRFPFPLARREYVYARRWWLTAPAADDERRGLRQAFALIVSRTGIYPPSDAADGVAAGSASLASSAVAAAATTAPAGTSVASGDSQSGLVSVRSYESNMFIRSHGTIDEPGLDYFLIYSDDPQLTISTEAASRISTSGKFVRMVPRLMDKLHDAALTISARGLPPSISPVVLLSSEVLEAEEKPGPPAPRNDADDGDSLPNPTPVEHTSTASWVYKLLFSS